MLGVWNNTGRLEGCLGHCYPQRGKTKTSPNKLQAYCCNSAPSKAYERLIKRVPPQETGHTSSMPGRFPKRSKLHGACRKALRTCRTGSCTTVSTFFDIKRAFDTIWHAKLLDKMQAVGITGRLYKFVQTFMDSRRMAVKVGDSKSKSHTLDMGVSQCSVVAPTLFSIMLHDIQRVGRPGLSISLYADDLAIWADCPASKNHQRHALERF